MNSVPYCKRNKDCPLLLLASLGFELREVPYHMSQASIFVLPFLLQLSCGTAGKRMLKKQETGLVKWLKWQSNFEELSSNTSTSRKGKSPPKNKETKKQEKSTFLSSLSPAI
jgi:hypothetical protein